MARLFLVGAIACICLVRTYFGGPIPVSKYGPDAFILLDGGWRIIQGQVPHVDFHTAIGPITYLLVAVGLKVSAYGATGLSYAQALAGLGVGLWAYGLAIRRLTGAPAVLFCLFAVLLTVAPHEIGESPLDLAPSFTYNRYSYGVLCLVLLEALSPLRQSRRSQWAEWLGGISTGVALALLLFLKISFFVGAALIVGAALPCRQQSKARWLGGLSAFAAVSIAMMIYLRADVAAVWTDFGMAGGSKTVPIRVAIQLLVSNAVPLVALLFLGVFASLLLSLEDNPRPVRFIPFSAIVVCGVTYLMILGSHQDAGVPICVAFALVLMDLVAQNFRDSADGDDRVVLHGAGLVGALLFIIPALATDSVSLAYGALKSIQVQRGAALEFDSQTLKTLLFTGPDSSRDFGRNYVQCVNEGLQLLRERSQSERTVTLANTDPFPHALGRVPARGGDTWLALGNNVSYRFKPSEERLFGDAESVLVSKYVTDGGATALYGEFVKRNYRLARQSRCWDLYARP